MSNLVGGRVAPQWTLADRLRKAREHAGLSQSELEQHAGISRRSISTYERGQTVPRPPQLAAWALVTGVDLGWLTTGEPTGATSPRP